MKKLWRFTKMRTRNWNKLYSTYGKRYANKVAKSRVGMEEKYSFEEFKVVYEALENDRKKELQSGARKVANITQDIVARQEKYVYTLKQAKTLRNAMREQFNEEYKLKDIRAGVVKTKEFWDVVNEYRKQTQNQVDAPTIGQVFFGSE